MSTGLKCKTIGEPQKHEAASPWQYAAWSLSRLDLALLMLLPSFPAQRFSAPWFGTVSRSNVAKKRPAVAVFSCRAMRTRNFPRAVVSWPKAARDLDATQQTTGGIQKAISTRSSNDKPLGSYARSIQRTVI